MSVSARTPCACVMMNDGDKTFKKRAAEIADHAHNPRGAVSEGGDFLRGLDEAERIRELSRTSVTYGL